MQIYICNIFVIISIKIKCKIIILIAIFNINNYIIQKILYSCLVIVAKYKKNAYVYSYS